MGTILFWAVLFVVNTFTTVSAVSENQAGVAALCGGALGISIVMLFMSIAEKIES